MKSHNIISYIVLFLIVLGIARTLVDSPMLIIIPVVLFALIVYWIKHPPAFLTRGQRAYPRNYRAESKQAKGKKERPRSKTVPFKVIEGGRDDNDTPRYH